MDLIEDVCFSALNDLDDIDTPANTTTFTNHFNTDVPRPYKRPESFRVTVRKVMGTSGHLCWRVLCTSVETA
jgi:hypothetical protein